MTADRAFSLGRLAPGLAVGLVVVLFAAHVDRFDFVSDDAFISFRYARNWADGQGLVFNPGERVEGYTNFLWTVMLGLGMRVGLDPVGLSKFLGLVFGAATLVVLAWLSARRRGRGSVFDAVVPCLAALSPALACWCSGGLETSLFTFLITLGWAAVLAQGDGGRESAAGSLRLGAVAGTSFGLAATTRPEGVLAFAVVAAHRVVEAWVVRRRTPARTGRSARSSSTLPDRGVLGAEDLSAVAMFLGVFGPYFAWRWWYYGWLFPNTYYVKCSTTYWGHGFAYLGSFAADHLLWALPILMLIQVVALQRVPVREWSLLVGLVLVLSLQMARVGGDFMALSRFAAPLVPALAWLGGSGLGALGGAPGQVLSRRVAVALLALYCAGGLGLKAYRVGTHALGLWDEAGIDSIGLLRLYAEHWTRVGRWLGENYDRDTTIAVNAAGAIPYYSTLPTLDALGLNDEYIAHEVPDTHNRPGHSKRAPVDYILRREVDLLILHPTLSTRRMGPPRDPANWNQRGYLWRTVEISAEEEEELWFGFWQRRQRQ